MRDYRKYEIWGRAHELVKEVYRFTASFPDEEKYNLSSQLRRATISIPLNIVEGSARHSDREFTRFLFISAGSAAEVEYLIFLCYELQIIEQSSFIQFSDKVNHVKRMIYKLIQALQSK